MFLQSLGPLSTLAMTNQIGSSMSKIARKKLCHTHLKLENLISPKHNKEISKLCSKINRFIVEHKVSNHIDLYWI